MATALVRPAILVKYLVLFGLAGLALIAMPRPTLAQGTGNPSPAPPIPLSSPPALNLQQMMERLQRQAADDRSRSAATGNAAPPGVPAPNLPAPTAPAPAIPTPTLPATLAPVAPRTPAIELPSELGDFTPSEPAASGAATSSPKGEGRRLIGPGIAVGPQGLPTPGQLLGMDGDAQLSEDLAKLSQLFQEDLGFRTSSPTLRAQSLAITFIDYLYRSDRPRLRALVGAPFYADEFPLENTEEVNKIFGEPAPILQPVGDVMPERVNDRLVGISTMRISELRDSEFYIGDRGADLLGLAEDDFFIHIVFERGGIFAPMVVYVRQIGDGFQIAGFYD